MFGGYKMNNLSKGEKISRALKGRKLSEEHKRKIAVAKLGKSRTIKTKAKIKQTRLGTSLDTMKEKPPLVPKTTMSRSNLTADDVKEIRHRYTNETGTSIRKLAEEYHVSRHTIHSIVTYKTWKPKI